MTWNCIKLWRYVSIEGQGHFLTLTQSQLHMKTGFSQKQAAQRSYFSYFFLFFPNHWANQSQILYVYSFQVQGNENLLTWCWSHDLNGLFYSYHFLYFWAKDIYFAPKCTGQPAETTGPIKAKFYMYPGSRKWKSIDMMLITWPKWPPRPYMVKTLKKSSFSEPVDRFPWNLVCRIWDSSPS